MLIRNRTTGAVITISEFKGLHPRTAFPKRINDLVLDSYGYDLVFEGPAANVSDPYEVSVYDGVEQVDGKWYTKYIAGPVFTDIEGGELPKTKNCVSLLITELANIRSQVTVICLSVIGLC